MFSKEESRRIKKEFWTKFGFFSQTKRVAMGLEKKWMTYNTGINSIILKFDFDKKLASVGIEIDANTSDEEEKYYNRFIALKSILDKKFEKPPTWNPDFKKGSEKFVHKIYHTLDNVSVFDTTCWPSVFQFFFTYMLIYEVFIDEFKDFLQKN
jgi:hypothetical protein